MKMDLEKVNKLFFKMEIENNLFEKKTEENIFYWDLLRYFIYYEIVYELGLRKRPKVTLKKENILKKILKFSKLIFNYMIFRILTIFKKNDIIFFMCSRNIDNLGNSYDLVSEHLYKEVKGNSLIIESFENVNRKDFFYSNFELMIIKKLKSREVFDNILGYDLEGLIEKEFGIRLDIKNQINDIINSFKIEYEYYTKLFTKLNPKFIFLTQNGLQKGLFFAANQKNIPVAEFQHGMINDFQLAYAYPMDIKFGMIKTLPTYLLTFGDFWNKVNYPVKEKITLGNNEYAHDRIELVNGKKIMIIYADIYMEDLLFLTKELLKKDKENKYIIKLHPNQKQQMEFIKNELKLYENKEIIYIEKSIDELLEEVKSVILIQSTVIYEALQKKKQVFVYKKQDYFTHNDVFNSKNVYLVDNASDILNKIEFDYKNENLSFFTSFDSKNILSVVRKCLNVK